MARTLTARQQEVYDFIRAEILSRGYGPTVREIALQLGIKSPNGVVCHLRALEKKGVIQRVANKSRAIELVLRAEHTDGTESLPVRGQVNGSQCHLFDAPESLNLMGLLNGQQRYLLYYSGPHLRDHAVAVGDILVVEQRAEHLGNGLELIRAPDGAIHLRPAVSRNVDDSVAGNAVQPADPASSSIDSHPASGSPNGHGQLIGIVVGILRAHGPAQDEVAPLLQFMENRQAMPTAS